MQKFRQHKQEERDFIPHSWHLYSSVSLHNKYLLATTIYSREILHNKQIPQSRSSVVKDIQCEPANANVCLYCWAEEYSTIQGSPQLLCHIDRAAFTVGWGIVKVFTYKYTSFFNNRANTANEPQWHLGWRCELLSNQIRFSSTCYKENTVWCQQKPLQMRALTDCNQW